MIVNVELKEEYKKNYALSRVTPVNGAADSGTVAVPVPVAKKKVTIKSKAVQSIGGNAFKGIAKKSVVKVPKAKKAAYKKLLKKAGYKKP